ncbi:hypothetical protein GUJ93_ZPchr0006g44023 [Zizania palustris]|uniref:Uncharacterized protein n=1 Tax=Zizania palustris TaxID=103762 RepID=A0A8J5VLE4_ZIZPA|nr:hypothetical protein GUJ93_ZPchr0006g44023 [Zizania palustris]
MRAVVNIAVHQGPPKNLSSFIGKASTDSETSKVASVVGRTVVSSLAKGRGTCIAKRLITGDEGTTTPNVEASTLEYATTSRPASPVVETTTMTDEEMPLAEPEIANPVAPKADPHLLSRSDGYHNQLGISRPE